MADSTLLCGATLLKPGSRIEYIKLLKVNEAANLNQLADQLRAVAFIEHEQVETYRTAGSGVQRFFDNFLFFLSLIGIFTLLLAGIGIQSSLTAFLKEREKTIAVVRTMGATSGFVTGHYFIIVSILGLIGTTVGLLLGYLLQTVFPILFAGFLPPNVSMTISGQTILQSLLLGMFIVGAFTFLPLYRLQDLKPSFILRKEYDSIRRGWPYYVTLSLVFIFFVGMILWQIEDPRIGSYFVGGMLGLILVVVLITQTALFFLKRTRLKPLAARQALRGLFRPRNSTASIVVTLSVSAAVIFSIYLIEQNLDASLIQSFPEDSPNLFFIDIQPDQLEDFAETLAVETTYYPIVRSTIVDVNGEAINRDEERERRGDSLARSFNLTYRTDLLDNEAFMAGDSLFREDWQGPQVSLLDQVLEIRQFQIGDMITFRIQGVPIQAQVSSIRTLTSESISPFFYFVFEPDILADAPQSIFTAVRVADSDVAATQNRMVAAFPNVSVVNVTAVVETFSGVAQRLSQIIRFLTLFSILAGILIIISSVFATRFARVQEAVYFKVLGAKSRFVLHVFTLENLFLGLISGAIALLISQVGSWAISKFVFEIPYHPFIGSSLTLVATTTILVMIVGLLASISILRQRPILFLRETSLE